MVTRTADDWADAALDAFAEGGLDAASIPKIARRLGVTKGSFYWHFHSQADLLDAALRRWEERDRVFLHEFDRITNARKRLLALFDEAAKASQAQALFIAFSGSTMPRVVAAMRRVSDRRIAFIRHAYEELGMSRGHANDRALLVYAAYIGILHLRPPRKIEAFIEHAIDTLVPRV